MNMSLLKNRRGTKTIAVRAEDVIGLIERKYSMLRRFEGEKIFQLVKLLREDPNWNFHKYAEELDIGEDSVRIIALTLWEMDIL